MSAAAAEEKEPTALEGSKPVLKELTKEQRRFAKEAIRALAKASGANQSDFEVFEVDPPDNTCRDETAHRTQDGIEDGTPWQEATHSELAKYAIRYAGETDLENFDPDSNRDLTIMVGANEKGRLGWSTPVYTTMADERNKAVPTVDIPMEI